MVGDTGVAAALLGLVILELLLINFVYMIMLQNAHIPAKAIPRFNSSHEYHVRPFLNHPRVKK